MKAVLLFLFVSSFLVGLSQPNIPFNLLNYQQFGKSVVASGKRPLDAKYKYYDQANFVSRAYKDTTEVRLVLPLNQRDLGQKVLVNTGGTLLNGVITGGTNTDWWYKDGTTDGSLVPFVAAGIPTNIYTSNGTFPTSTNRTATIPPSSTLQFPQTISGTAYNKIFGFYNNTDGEGEDYESYESSVLKTTADSVKMQIGNDSYVGAKSFEVSAAGPEGKGYLNLTKLYTTLTYSSGPYRSVITAHPQFTSLYADSLGKRSTLEVRPGSINFSLVGGAKFKINNVLGTPGQAVGIDGGGDLAWITAGGGGSPVNIGNSDLTLTGNRVLSGGGYNLTIGNGIGSNIGAFTVNSSSFQFNGNGGTTVIGNASGKFTAQSDTIRLNAINQLQIPNLPLTTDPTASILVVNSVGVASRINTLYITNDFARKTYVDSLATWHRTSVTAAGTTTLATWPLNQVNVRASSTITGTVQVDLPDHPAHGAQVWVMFENTSGGIAANTVTLRATGSDQIIVGTFTNLYTNESIHIFYDEPTLTWHR